jgi:hypothetical protein
MDYLLLKRIEHQKKDLHRRCSVKVCWSYSPDRATATLYWKKDDPAIGAVDLPPVVVKVFCTHNL